MHSSSEEHHRPWRSNSVHVTGRARVDGTSVPNQGDSRSSCRMKGHVRNPGRRSRRAYRNRHPPRPSRPSPPPRNACRTRGSCGNRGRRNRSRCRSRCLVRPRSCALAVRWGRRCRPLRPLRHRNCCRCHRRELHASEAAHRRTRTTSPLRRRSCIAERHRCTRPRGENPVHQANRDASFRPHTGIHHRSSRCGLRRLRWCRSQASPWRPQPSRMRLAHQDLVHPTRARLPRAHPDVRPNRRDDRAELGTP